MLKQFFIALYATAMLLIGPGLRGAVSTEVPTPDLEPDYLINVWQTDNGLPQNWVSSLAQTPDGYLWVGTRYGGLARFDGVRFVTFNQQNTKEIQDVQVEHLSVDETGRLWIIMGNESVTALQAGTFRLYNEPRATPKLRLDHVLLVNTNFALFNGELPYVAELNFQDRTNRWEILGPKVRITAQPATFTVDQEGTLWFITQRRRLARYFNGTFEIMPNVQGWLGASTMALTVDSARRLWLATSNRLWVWDNQHFIESTPANGPLPTGIQQIAFSGDGGLWVLEQNRLRKCLNGQWVVETDPRQFQTDATTGTLSLFGDAQGNAWLISYGRGLWHLKADGSAHLLTEKTGLPSAFITCWFQDMEGNAWVGTAGGGLARIRESMFHVLGKADGLPGKVVRSVCMDHQGKLWVGMMAGGLAGRQGDSFESVPLPATGANPTESVTAYPASDGSLWVGTINHGLMRLQNGEFTRTPVTWETIRVLFGDSRGDLWVGGLVGLIRLNRDNQTTPFGITEGFADGHAIGAIAEDDRGAIWIGTGPGELWKYQAGQFQKFRPPAAWPSVRFSAVLPDTNGTVWVGTLGGGLLRFADGRFTRCTQLNGLPDDNVSQLLDSQDGYIWAGTYAGIFRASKADLEAAAAGRTARVPCRAYGRFDGLPTLECSSGFQPASWRSRDGRLFFSTANGVVTVNPQKISVNPVPPNVIIEEMLVDGQPVEIPARKSSIIPSTNAPAPVILQPGRHYVQFRFTGLNFAAPDGIRFRVKLAGGEKGWQSVGAQRIIGYGPLLPGDYQLQVIACNNEGIWNEVGDELAFTVLPYFWETKWFQTGLAVMALTALTIGVARAQRRRYRRCLERIQRQHEMEHERTRIARDLHDDLGTSLTQISLLSALANREQTSPQESKELIQQVRGRARDMVVALDEIVWAVNPKNDSLAGLVNYLGHFVEEFFHATGIHCRLDFPSDIPEQALSADVRHHLFLAFKEAINNAARHAEATHVRVRIEILAAELVIEVQDNGRGFEPPNPLKFKPGNGLTNMALRLEQIGGRTEMQSAPKAGTTITFHAPLKPR